jgi:hypothetical protein
MEWITHAVPEESGTYLISGQVMAGSSRSVFNYIAYYSTEAKSWYKYDPFTNKVHGEEIPVGYVTAWKETGSVFIK